MNKQDLVERFFNDTMLNGRTEYAIDFSNLEGYSKSMIDKGWHIDEPEKHPHPSCVECGKNAELGHILCPDCFAGKCNKVEFKKGDEEEACEKKHDELWTEIVRLLNRVAELERKQEEIK